MLGWVRHHEEEFFAAVAADRLHWVERVSHAPPELLQHRIAGQMSPGIVDLLEIIGVDQQHGELAVVLPRLDNRLLQIRS